MPCPSQSSRFNHPDYIRWTVQTMKFLIVEPFSLPNLIPLGPKFSPQINVILCKENLRIRKTKNIYFFSDGLLQKIYMSEFKGVNDWHLRWYIVYLEWECGGIYRIKRRKLSWMEHMLKMDDSRWPRQIFEKHVLSKRKGERPMTPWKTWQCYGECGMWKRKREKTLELGIGKEARVLGICKKTYVIQTVSCDSVGTFAKYLEPYKDLFFFFFMNIEDLFQSKVRRDVLDPSCILLIITSLSYVIVFQNIC